MNFEMNIDREYNFAAASLFSMINKTLIASISDLTSTVIFMLTVLRHKTPPSYKQLYL